MKKYLSILMIAVLAVFASCSNDDDDKAVYTVTFETDGGTPVPFAQRVEEGSTATVPSTNPAKAGRSQNRMRLQNPAVPLKGGTKNQP